MTETEAAFQGKYQLSTCIHSSILKYTDDGQNLQSVRWISGWLSLSAVSSVMTDCSLSTCRSYRSTCFQTDKKPCVFNKLYHYLCTFWTLNKYSDATACPQISASSFYGFFIRLKNGPDFSEVLWERRPVEKRGRGGREHGNATLSYFKSVIYEN